LLEQAGHEVRFEIKTMEELHKKFPLLKDLDVIIIPTHLTPGETSDEGVRIAQQIHNAYKDIPMIAMDSDDFPTGEGIPKVIDLGGASEEYLNVAKVITAI
jgi:hypothetical protein